MSDHLGSCEACAGRCCRSYLVPLTGFDVWRLSTGQRLGPEQFTVAYPNREPATRGFVLEAGGPELALALDKRGRFHALAPCVFLLQLGGGVQRCGVYEDRPTACRIYPMGLVNGRVVQRPDTLCPPGSWPSGSAAEEEWGAALRRARLEGDVHAAVVDRWNRQVEQTPSRAYGLTEYLHYLLNVYDQLHRLEVGLGSARMSAIVTSWPVRDADLTGPPELWRDYLHQADVALSRCEPIHA